MKILYCSRDKANGTATLVLFNPVQKDETEGLIASCIFTIMLIYGPAAAAFCVRTSLYCVSSSNNSTGKSRSCLTRYSRRCSLAASFLAAAAAAAVIVSAAGAAEIPQDSETLSNIPQTLSGECGSSKDCKKPRIQRPKSRKAESCTVKCLTTCIRGGEGSPGEGPFNIRRPIVVFKEGFRSRKYWYPLLIYFIIIGNMLLLALPFNHLVKPILSSQNTTSA